MMKEPDSDYYLRRREKLLRGFDRLAARLTKSLAARHGDAFAEAVVAETRVNFAGLIPSLPYIGGGRNIFTWVMIVNGGMVALYRAMEARGQTAEGTVRVCAEVFDELFRSWPGSLLRLAGKLSFTPVVRRVLRKQAERSQRRQYAADFVYELREVDDELALVFDECAVNKYYEAEKAEALKPYCNFFDVTYSRLMDMGVDARETIGLGCEKCSLRYKHRRDTVIPASLDGVLPRT